MLHASRRARSRRPEELATASSVGVCEFQDSSNLGISFDVKGAADAKHRNIIPQGTARSASRSPIGLIELEFVQMVVDARLPQ